MNNLNYLLLDYVYLAEASYTDFYKSGSDFAKLTDEKNGKIPNSFATLITNNYQVSAHYTDRTTEGENSFSGTLFQNKETGQYVLSMRGTQEYGVDLKKTDIGDILYDGLAHHQIVDMYNFWQQIKAPKDTAYTMKRLVLDEQLTEELRELKSKIKNEADFYPNSTTPQQLVDFYKKVQANGYILDDNRKEVFQIKELSSDMVYSSSDDRQKGLGIDVGSVIVSGHSLGGHLTAAFSRLFPEITEHAYMVNGAGFGQENTLVPNKHPAFNLIQNIENLFNGLNPNAAQFDGNKITNIIGDKNPDVVANDWKIGLAQPTDDLPELFIELATPSLPNNLFGNILGHSASQMTDSMAVIDLFMRLDKSLQQNSVKEILTITNDILSAAARDDKRTLETVVEKISKLLNPASEMKVKYTQNHHPS